MVGTEQQEAFEVEAEQADTARIVFDHVLTLIG